MDPFTIGLLKTIASQGAVASLLLLVGIMLYRNLKAKESCKDPSPVIADPLPGSPPREHMPCNQCLACKDRLLSEERSAHTETMAAERAKFEGKVEELHNEVRDLLREMARAIHPHGNAEEES